MNTHPIEMLIHIFEFHKKVELGLCHHWTDWLRDGASSVQSDCHISKEGSFESTDVRLKNRSGIRIEWALGKRQSALLEPSIGTSPSLGLGGIERPDNTKSQRKLTTFVALLAWAQQHRGRSPPFPNQFHIWLLRKENPTVEGYPRGAKDSRSFFVPWYLFLYHINSARGLEILPR